MRHARLVMLICWLMGGLVSAAHAQSCREDNLAATEIVALPVGAATGPIDLQLGRFARPVTVIIAAGQPAVLRISRVSSTQIAAVISLGAEVTVEGLQSQTRFIQHRFDAPITACSSAGVPLEQPMSTGVAALTVNRAALVMIGRAPDQVASLSASPTQVGNFAGLSEGDLVSGNTTADLLTPEQIRARIEAQIEREDSATGVAAPDVVGCQVPTLPDGTRIEALAVQRGTGRAIRETASLGAMAVGAGRVDVAITDTTAPVALLVNGLLPIEWRIGLGEGAQLAAVVLTGLSAQSVVGPAADVPVIRFDGHALNSGCWDAGLQPFAALSTGQDPDPLTRMSQQVFGRAPDNRRYEIESERVVIGPDAEVRDSLLTFDPAYGRVFAADMVRAGLTGLAQLLDRGVLTISSEDEIRAWYSIAYPVETATVGRYVVPGLSLRFGNAFTLQSRSDLPEGLTDDDAVYLLPRGLPMPRTGLEHTQIYRMEDGTCLEDATRPCLQEN